MEFGELGLDSKLFGYEREGERETEREEAIRVN